MARKTAETRGSKRVRGRVGRGAEAGTKLVIGAPQPVSEVDRRKLDFEAVVEAIDLCDSMICDSNYHDVNSCNPNDLACLIHNNGEPADRVEAFLALAPIAKRVSERMDPEIEERNARTRQAVGKILREAAAKK